MSSKLSREDFRRQKLIEEQRKAGTLPAEVDEEGKAINPHIPHYIAQAPWYLDIGAPTLRHQRAPNSDSIAESKEDDWYARGARTGPPPKKYRKGACENCGAMSHKTKECMERPRRIKARFSGTNLAADEVVGTDRGSVGFEAKRDRWNGYNAGDFQRLVEEGEMIEAERKKIREQKVREKLEGGIGGELASDSEDDEEKYADQADMPGQKLDTKTRTTVRNLRIREDTAKYLLNLDLNSAYYDPKTRSMRDNPLPDSDAVAAGVGYGGDNFVRWTGDAVKMTEQQMFAWQAAERGKEVLMAANPTLGEQMFKEFQKRKEIVKDSQRSSILEKYGGEEHLNAPPKELLMSQTEQYVEYSQAGRLIKGQEKAHAKSKYEEDVFPLNHTSIWGSYWKDGKWGYACCHATYRNAYCMGRPKAEEPATTSVPATNATEDSRSTSKSLLEQHVEGLGKGKNSVGASSSTTSNSHKRQRLGEGDVEIDRKKLKKALAAEEERKRKGLGEKEAGGEVTQEELEAYRMLRTRADDPMEKMAVNASDSD